MFSYPKHAECNRVVPKTRIYHYARPSARIKQAFVDRIDKVVWRYKLAPETVNLPARPGSSEIQIFNISLKSEDPGEELLRSIDQAIPFPIFYELEFQNRIRLIAAYKRTSDADSAKWVVDSYFASPWLPADVERTPLPVALNMEKLYEAMLRQLMPLPPLPDESLQAQVARLAQIHNTQKQADKLESRLYKEKQFNRKVEINSRLRQLKSELDRLFTGGS